MAIEGKNFLTIDQWQLIFGIHPSTGLCYPFFYKYTGSEDWRRMLGIYEGLDVLASNGSLPKIYGFRQVPLEGAGVVFFMENIKGFDLDHIPNKLRDLPYSLEFVKSLARLHLDFYNAKLWHRDLRPANIMYSQEKGKCTAVDFEAIHPNKNQNLNDYIYQLSLTLRYLYTRDQLFDSIDDSSASLLKRKDPSLFHPDILSFVLNEEPTSEDLEKILSL